MTQYKNTSGIKDKTIHMAQLKTEHLSGQDLVKNLYKTDDEFKKKLNLDRYNDMFSKNADGYFKYVWYSHLQHIILDFCKKFIVDKNTF